MLEYSDFILLGLIFLSIVAIFTAVLYVAVTIFVEKELLKMSGKLQTFKASLSKMRGGGQQKEGFDWMQLIDAGRLVLDMKKEGMTVKDIVTELAGIETPAEET